MQHAPGVDEVEGLVGKRQPLGIGHAQVGLEPERLEATPHMIDRTLCQVDAGQAAAGLGEQLMVRAEADADLQHVPVPRLGGVGKRGNERLELVSPAALREIARLVAAAKVEVLAAGCRVPEVVDAADGVHRFEDKSVRPRWGAESIDGEPLAIQISPLTSR